LRRRRMASRFLVANVARSLDLKTVVTTVIVTTDHLPPIATHVMSNNLFMKEEDLMLGSNAAAAETTPTIGDAVIHTVPMIRSHLQAVS
jgi:hypothetical protein